MLVTSAVLNGTKETPSSSLVDGVVIFETADSWGQSPETGWKGSSQQYPSAQNAGRQAGSAFGSPPPQTSPIGQCPAPGQIKPISVHGVALRESQKLPDGHFNPADNSFTGQK